MNKNNFCVIMAGGIGSRFWPMSKTARPKQFIDILGTGKTLLQQTFDRFLKICPKENILIVTNEIYRDIVKEQLPWISDEQVLGEPQRCNTAPCIAYANHKILKANPDANIVVAPSDHLITKEDVFTEVILKGLDFTANNDALLTLGIQPNRPETGYGYIQVSSKDKNREIKKVKTFTEKPNYEMAKAFVESGEFSWNSGIFIWSLKSIIKAFDSHLDDVNTLFYEGKDYYNTPREKDFISGTYNKCRKISIDYGVMEKADNVFVYTTEIGWSDLGTWGSLYSHLEKDKNGNAINSDKVFNYETKNCIVNVPDNKLVVMQGLEDYIVVESDNVLLICRKHDEQQIKNYVEDVKELNGDKYL